jgi:NitT/TauT family transport system substrate-binding protein
MVTQDEKEQHGHEELGSHPGTLRARTTPGPFVKRRQVLAALAAAAGAAVPAIGRAADPVRIVTSALDATAEPYYASDLGFFAEAGIDAQIQTLSNGAAVSAAVASGTVDIGCSGLPNILLAFRRGIPFIAVAPASLYVAGVPTTVLLVPPNSTAASARDLNGKTIAAAGLKTISEYAPRWWMDKNGGDSSTVKFIEMNNPQIIDALAAARIDAAVMPEPFLAEAKRVARVFANAYDAIGSRFLLGAFFANLDGAHSHADVVRRFRNVMARTAAWANGHPQQSGEILAKYAKVDPATVKSMLRIAYAERLEPRQMQPLIEVLAHYGAISGSFPAEELIFRG